MNYYVLTKHCQLGTGACMGMISSDKTELINFGTVERKAGVKMIPLSQVDSNTPTAEDSRGHLIAQLITDEYFIPGTVDPTNSAFEGPWDDGTGFVVIRSSNPDELLVISSDEGYELEWSTYIVGNTVDDGAIVGGYETMADGTVAKLYIVKWQGAMGHYNSVTRVVVCSIAHSPGLNVSILKKTKV